MDTKINNKSLRAGFIDGIPVAIALFFLFFAVGATYSTIGIEVFTATISTIVIFSAPAQLATMDLLSEKNWLALLFMVGVINIRFVFMSSSLMPHFRDVPRKYLYLALQMLSASTFAVTFLKCKTSSETNAFCYFLGVALISFPVAIIGTSIGSIFSKEIGAEYIFILNMILPVYFSYLLAKLWPQFIFILSGIGGFVLAPIIEAKYHNMGLLISALLVGYAVLIYKKATVNHE